MFSINTEVKFSRSFQLDLLDTLRDRGIPMAEVVVIIDSKLTEIETFRALLSGGLTVIPFDATKSEPKSEDVDALVQQLRTDFGCSLSLVVAIGGGSTMDLGKAVAIMLGNLGPSNLYQGWDKGLLKGIPCVVIPTIAGTGAEVTPIAVLRGPERKLGLNSPFVAPMLAIIDPTLCETVPTEQAWYTMTDCYLHSMEIERSYTSSVTGKTFARSSLDISSRLLFDSDTWSREQLNEAVVASFLGGLATLGGRVGACHALSYGVSSVSNVRHSVANILSLIALDEVYYDLPERILESASRRGIYIPRLLDFGINEGALPKIKEVTSSMTPLWHSHYGESADLNLVNKLVDTASKGLFQ